MRRLRKDVLFDERHAVLPSPVSKADFRRSGRSQGRGVSISAVARIERLALHTVARWLEKAADVCRGFIQAGRDRRREARPCAVVARERKKELLQNILEQWRLLPILDIAFFTNRTFNACARTSMLSMEMLRSPRCPARMAQSARFAPPRAGSARWTKTRRPFPHRSFR